MVKTAKSLLESMAVPNLLLSPKAQLNSDEDHDSSTRGFFPSLTNSTPIVLVKIKKKCTCSDNIGTFVSDNTSMQDHGIV
jgi:hypothetical protein